MSIYSKKKYVEQQKRRFGQIDEQYLKRADDLLSGELAEALGIPKDEVQRDIVRRVREAKETAAE